MRNYYLISSKLNPGMVIDFRMQTEPITRLQVFPVNKPETDNQLWEFVPDPAGSSYYFIKSKLGLYVFDVKGGSATSNGTPLQIHTQNDAGFTDNQLWEFVPDPDGSGYNFIKSKLGEFVIDIKRATAAPHTELQVLPKNATGKFDHQLWNCTPGPESSFDPKLTLLFNRPPNISVSGNGFVALNRISLWYTFADPVSGVDSSTSHDPVFARATALGEFRYSIATHESVVNSGSTVEIIAVDGTNRVAVNASFDGKSKSWIIV